MCLVTNITRSTAAECSWNGDRTLLNTQLQGQDFADPRWCYNLNLVSLIVGFIGNFFLLCNFTNRIRYIIALPVTILCWYVATGILIGITVAMQLYVPPMRPQQTYTQGFWYGVIAACMYLICSMVLMVNMLGYWLGHYPQHFTLTESQRTLILQTMLFFVWLAAGGGIFSAVERRYGNYGPDDFFPWGFVNSLYFSDVTILTVGFGDLYPSSDIGRGLVFPYSVGGIIMLGLMVSSIAGFARELSSENVVKRHVEKTRVRTMDRTVTTSLELERKKVLLGEDRPTISAPYGAEDKSKERTIDFADDVEDPKARGLRRTGTIDTIKRAGTWALLPQRRAPRKTKLLLLKEEKDRFEAMRHIQKSTSRFKNWYALLLSVTAFGLLWCGGGVVFWQAEKNTENEMTYFKALYFAYVSLLTIGYGDLSPKSNAGRPFFVFWSLVAVPTMTILVSDLGDTVIKKFKNGTSGVADFTVLPQRGVWRAVLNKQPWLLDMLQSRKARKELRRKEEEGLPYGPEPEDEMANPTIDELAEEETTEAELAAKLSKAIKRAARDLKHREKTKYSYEEWVEFTRLIRFTAKDQDDLEQEEQRGMVEWDWIGEDSPMMANTSEAEFVLDRLCESLSRYVRKVEKTLAAASESTIDAGLPTDHHIP